MNNICLKKGTIQHLRSLPCVRNWTFSDVVKKGRPPNRVENSVSNSTKHVCKFDCLQTVSSQAKGFKSVHKKSQRL